MQQQQSPDYSTIATTQQQIPAPSPNAAQAHYKKRNVIPEQGTTGLCSDLNSQVEVFAPRKVHGDNDKILVLPRSNIIQWPTQEALLAKQNAKKKTASAAGILQQQQQLKVELCPDFDAASETESSCTRGAACPHVHAYLDDNVASRDIHVNYAWRHPDECTFERFEPGALFSVAPPNEYEVRDAIPSHMALRTKAFESNRRVLSHCAHYYFNRMCNRGPDCYFVHAVSLAGNTPLSAVMKDNNTAVPTSAAPIASSSDDEQEQQQQQQQQYRTPSPSELLSAAVASGLQTGTTFGRTTPAPALLPSGTATPPAALPKKTKKAGSESSDKNTSAAPSCPPSVASHSLNNKIQPSTSGLSPSPAVAYLGSRKDSLMGTPGFMSLNQSQMNNNNNNSNSVLQHSIGSYNLSNGASVNASYQQAPLPPPPPPPYPGNSNNSNHQSINNSAAPSYQNSVMAQSLQAPPQLPPTLSASSSSIPQSHSMMSMDSLPNSPMRNQHQQAQIGRTLAIPSPMTQQQQQQNNNHNNSAPAYYQHHQQLPPPPPPPMPTQSNMPPPPPPPPAYEEVTGGASNVFSNNMMMGSQMMQQQQQQQAQQQQYQQVQQQQAQQNKSGLAAAFRLGDSDDDQDNEGGIENHMVGDENIIFYSATERKFYEQPASAGDGSMVADYGREVSDLSQVSPKTPVKRRRVNNPYSMERPVRVREIFA